MTLIPPYDHADVIAGQGTVAKELIEEVGALDYLFVCVGGGGLITGCALAAAALSPGLQGHRRRAGGRQRRPAVIAQRPHRAHRDAARRSPTARRRPRSASSPSRSCGGRCPTSSRSATSSFETQMRFFASA